MVARSRRMLNRVIQGSLGVTKFSSTLVTEERRLSRSLTSDRTHQYNVRGNLPPATQRIHSPLRSRSDTDKWIDRAPLNNMSKRRIERMTEMDVVSTRPCHSMWTISGLVNSAPFQGIDHFNGAKCCVSASRKTRRRDQTFLVSDMGAGRPHRGRGLGSSLKKLPYIVA